MGSRLFCIFQNYFLEKQRESCGVQYKAKKRSVKGMKKMTIFEYLYGTYIIQMNMETLILIPVWILIMN